MFERFTEKAIKVIMLAQEEARRLGHNFVGTEQILLGLIGEGTGVAAKVLKSMGVNLKDARVEVEKIIGRGSGFCHARHAPTGVDVAWSARATGITFAPSVHQGGIASGKAMFTRDGGRLWAVGAGCAPPRLLRNSVGSALG